MYPHIVWGRFAVNNPKGSGEKEGNGSEPWICYLHVIFNTALF